MALAAAGCGGHAAGDAGNVPPANHELRLLDELGQPVAQTRALIDGKVVTTNDDGVAELGELPDSYDVVIALGTDVRAFLGLKSRSPTIEITNRDLGLNEHVNHVNVATANKPPNQAFFLASGVNGANVTGQTLGYNNDDQSYWADISWAGSGDVTLSAQAFLADLDPEGQSVIGYSGLASKTWPNAAQQSSVDWTPEFQSPSFETKTIHVELSIPDGASVSWYAVDVRLPSGEFGSIGSSRAGTSADLLVPDLPGATFDIFAVLDGGSYQVEMHSVSAGATVQAQGGQGVPQLAPQDGLNHVTFETDFSWSAPPGSVSELNAFSDSSTQPYYNYVVATTDSSARLPDTSALGVPFPEGVTLQWIVHAIDGHATLDEDAAGAGTETGTAFSDYRTFTTAP